MSRSVSAPSSVTKTSPCWNGLIVPGSTLRYGSNFWHVTFNPRLSSRQPMEAAAIPLPSDDTTPPVTKINLAIPLVSPRDRRFKELAYPFEILGRIHAHRLVFRFHHPDGVPVLESPQLFQALRLLQRPDRQVGVAEQEIPAIDVEPDMFVMRRPCRLAVADVGNSRARKIDRIAGTVRDYFDHVRIADLARIFDPLLQRAHHRRGVVDH